ncbi:MAG: S8 family serine peptidase [Phycisphaerae bacterium]|nr:S8 family serine peptidase [Phycisphaerae bacterium]
MKVHRGAVAALMLSAGMTVCVGSAWAQRAIAFGSRTGWASNNPPPVLTTSSSGTGAATTAGSVVTSGGSTGAVLYRADIGANENGDATFDSINVNNTGNFVGTNFLLGINSDVVVPILVNGRVIFGGNTVPLANHSETNVTVRAELWRETGVGTGVFASTGQSTQYQQLLTGPIHAPVGTTWDINFTGVARFLNQTGGDNRRYQVRVTFLTGGNVNLAGFSEVGSEFRIDLSSAANYGAVVSVSAEPAGYAGNSRGAVGAARGRGDFGVTGSGFGGVRAAVGILEPGVSYGTHASLAGRLTVLNNGTAGNRADEHTLAVAGIIGSNGPDEASSGVAPGARLASASIGDWGGTIAGATALRAHFGAGTPFVLNYSASDAGCSVQALDRFISDNPNITWVAAAGNEQLTGPGAGFAALGNVETPGYAYNIISVGALEGGFDRPTDFSSTTGGAQPLGPHIVASGEYTLAPASRDINANGAIDDYTRSFLGDDWRYAGAATTGRIAGTSFAAPHVAGAIALLHDYALNHAGDFDGASRDHRVMKAVTLAGAVTSGIADRAGNAWSQGRTGAGTMLSPLLVTRSLDNNLGAGRLDVPGMLSVYAQREALASDGNAARNFQISMVGASGVVGTGGTRTGFWDLENAGAGDGTEAGRGTVDYLLGGLAIPTPFSTTFAPLQSYLRAVLTWDAPTNAAGTAYTGLPNLELRFYCDGFNAGNVAGFDPANPADDILLARTTGAGENIRLLDLFMSAVTSLAPAPGATLLPNFYIQVANLSTSDVTYGLAVSLIPIPLPSGGVVVLVGVALAARRRRAA